jgi:glutamate/tyrosine decarboxylase-like PLP-dependent enzyme
MDNFLFPHRDDCLKWDHHLTELLAKADQRVALGPVVPTIDRGDLKSELSAFDFQNPVEFGALLSWVITRMESGLVHLNHPRYLGLFNPGATFPAQCADRITSVFNPQLASATTSPAAVEIEAHVARAVARRAGLGSEAVGHFTSGGSEANYTALICALTRAEKGFAAIGSRAFSGQPVFYISKDSHLAWIKIAHQAGIGRVAAHLVPTDGTGRLSLKALSTAIQTDVASGRVPFMLVATAGTTNAGMIDPLVPCAEIARKEGLWYHVDAAWGGGVVASERLRGLLDGIENADSVTIDAHKWFATTMGCGMFLTPHATVLSDAFNVSVDFMPSHAPALDPYLTTAQWSRRFLGLRLFLSLAAGGWAAQARHVEHSFERMTQLTDALEQRDWKILNGQSSLAVACLEPPTGSAAVREIVHRVVASGRAWLSVANFEGRDIVRACVSNGETSPSDIVEVVEALEAARRL